MLAISNHPQPALLYIVPFTLLFVSKQAVSRKEILQIWRGIPKSGNSQSYQKVSKDSKDVELQSEDQGFVSTV